CDILRCESAEFIQAMNCEASCWCLLLLNDTMNLPPGKPPHRAWHGLATACQLNFADLSKALTCQLPLMYTGTCWARKISLAALYFEPACSQRSLGITPELLRSAKSLTAAVALSLSRATLLSSVKNVVPYWLSIVENRCPETSIAMAYSVFLA